MIYVSVSTDYCISAFLQLSWIYNVKSDYVASGKNYCNAGILLVI